MATTPTVRKADSNVSMNFPDVCKTPGSSGGIGNPLPYPSVAKTAIEKTQQKTTPSVKQTVRSSAHYSGTLGDQPGTLKGVVSSTSLGSRSSGTKTAEVQALKGMLGQLNTKLQNMTSSDPNEWQALLQDYSVTASALYVTLHSDD